MLGRQVTATIYGAISNNNIYTGYVDNKVNGIIKNESVYIISHKPLNQSDGSIHGVVIATVFNKDSSCKLIVAPFRDIFYEPEIRELFSSLRNFSYTNLNCLYEKSCGAIIFHKDSNNNLNNNGLNATDLNTKELDSNDLKILLVKNHNGKFWSFPKGHMELGETEEQTAIREIKEETGLDVSLLNNFREISDYVPFGCIKKRVVFFLAETKKNEVTIQPSEIDSYTWVTFDKAIEKCNYENDLRLLKKARAVLFSQAKNNSNFPQTKSS